jgi:hypothetical protein
MEHWNLPFPGPQKHAQLAPNSGHCHSGVQYFLSQLVRPDNCRNIAHDSGQALGKERQGTLYVGDVSEIKSLGHPPPAFTECHLGKAVEVLPDLIGASCV